MELETDRKARAILRVLGEAEAPLTSAGIARELELLDIDLKERMVRYYLAALDEAGLTEHLGRGGRRITPRGADELRAAVAGEKLGLVSARVDELSYAMDLDLGTGEGTVVLNVSRLRASDLGAALEWIGLALDRGLGMGPLVAVAREGEVLGGRLVDPGSVALGTVCSITLNGVLRAAGIPVTSRFGGVLELRDGAPHRFRQIIHYDGTTVDPVEIFLKARMMRVRDAATTGGGTIGAGFRELPAAALGRARERMAELAHRGLLGGIHLLGRPGQPLLGIPVSPGRVGLVVAAGLNPIAAVEEAGIETANHAMATLYPFRELVSARELTARFREASRGATE